MKASSAKKKKKSQRTATEQTARARKKRPCCGLQSNKCQCKPPPGMSKKPLAALAKRFMGSPLSTVQDTTDVSAFQTLMRDRCKSMPTSAVLGYCYIHVVFNQRHLLEAMIKEKAFMFRQPWVDWKRLHKVVARAKAQNLLVRSSNFYSATLQKVLLQSELKVPKDPVARDVLACKLVGFMAMPNAVCDLYDAGPSRDLWKAMLVQWLCQVSSTCAGAFGHYYMKCCLDRLFAVRKVDHGSISWWPTECPSYRTWYKDLYVNSKGFNEEQRFQILCAIYRKLSSMRTCTFTDALAQTCWSMKEKSGNLKLM